LHFIPRLSLVIFIEFFSFFFLKLYRNSLHEIKYYQNELTNLEVKSTAITFAVNYGKVEDISLIIKDISSTERNFKLQKDESTVELERNKAETHDLKEILKVVLGTVAKKDK
jgi:undecaprenyl pyrophosphate synthase